MEVRSDDDYQSFPSSHAQISAASMFYVSLLMFDASLRAVRENNVLNRNRACQKPAGGGCPRGSDVILFVRRYSPSAHALLIVLPVLLPLWVGATRVREGFHYASDVLAGLLIGAFGAIVAYVVCCHGHKCSHDKLGDQKEGDNETAYGNERQHNCKHNPDSTDEIVMAHQPDSTAYKDSGCV